MTTMREFTCDDLLNFGNINTDIFTETFNLNFYLNYLVRWPDCNYSVDSPDQKLQGYVIGKVEGTDELWHGHVTALSVAPEYRRIGLASRLMNILEYVSDLIYNTYFVDLFVRYSNHNAIKMYNSLGYIVYQRVIGYYSSNEDALIMRRALSKDVDRKSVIPCPNPIKPHELYFN